MKKTGESEGQTSEFPIFETSREAKQHVATVTRKDESFDGLIFAVRDLVKDDAVQALRRNALSILGGTPGGWARLERGASDFWWTNDNHPQSTVKGCFTQVNFFPWNYRGSEILEIVRPVFKLREEVHTLLVAPTQSHTVEAFERVAIQIYPKGVGWLQAHADPSGAHQTLVASIVLSHFGSDYHHGGLFVKSRHDDAIFVERTLMPGDVVFFDPATIHGVETIDPGALTQPVESSPFITGRWMALCATNLADRTLGQGVARPEGN